MHYLVYHPEQLQAPLPLLDPATLDATEQAAYAVRGEPYLVERTLLRRELARISGEAPESIRFSYTPHGKPEYAPAPFNLSHSAGLLCLAFHHSAIGVDIERVRPLRHAPASAARIMCPQQHAAWLDRGSPEQEFFECWCAAEALVKLHGDTIWQAQRYPFLHHGAGGIEALFEPAPVVRLICPAPGFAGAVAYMPDAASAAAD